MPELPLFAPISLDLLGVGTDLLDDLFQSWVEAGVEGERVREREGAGDRHAGLLFFDKKGLNNCAFHLVT